MGSFEKKMEQLETNVKALEAGDIDLDKAIAKYTETMKIANECEKELQSAREQVAKVLTEAGELKTFEE